jgi:uncharacterized protein (UPF0332 family)
MSNIKDEVINFRLTRADESLAMASVAATNNYWSSVVSELYYTCFYLVSALFARNDIKASTHSGVKTLLGQQFIKTGLIDAKWGELFSELFDMRQDGDYRDFKIFTEEEVLPFISQVEEFRDVIKTIIAKKIEG